MIMLTTLSYGQNTKKSVFNQKNNIRLNKSFGVLDDSILPEKPISLDDYLLKMDNFELLGQEKNKNTTLYSSKINENTIRLDSISTVNFNQDGVTGKDKYVYDANGNRILQINYLWNTEAAAFIPNYKNENTYDANGNQTLRVNYLWNTEAAAFIPNYKNEFSYDENGRETLQAYYEWDTEAAALVPSYKYEFSYDENGNQTLRVYYRWDTEAAALIPDNKSEFTYDENGNQTLRVYYRWDTEAAALILDNKSEFTYDENGREIRSIAYQWDTEASAFIPDNKSERTYDENGEITSALVFNWNSNIEIFYPTAKTFFDFDNQNRVVSENTYGIDICNNEKVLVNKIEYSYIEGLEGSSFRRYSVTNGVAVFAYEIGNFYKNGKLVLRTQNVNPDIYGTDYNFKQEYEYDENGYETLLIFYRWNEQTSTLEPNFKRERMYDDEYNYKQVLFSKWYANIGVYKPSVKKEYDIIIDTATKLVRQGLLSVYDSNFNQWNTLNDEKYKSYWYYTKTSTLSSETFSSKTTIVFPNPTSKFLKVSLQEQFSNPMLEIYDATGKKVLSKKIVSDEDIDVSNLTPSIYFYKIKDGKLLKKSGKIIKQ